MQVEVANTISCLLQQTAPTATAEGTQVQINAREQVKDLKSSLSSIDVPSVKGDTPPGNR